MAERRIGQAQVIQRETSLIDLVHRLNNQSPDAVVSLHLNAYDGTVAGCETLHYPGSEEGEELAREIHPRVLDAVGSQNRGVKGRDELAILSHTNVPAVLLEPAFIDNRTDREAALRNADKVAEAIASGVKAAGVGG